MYALETLPLGWNVDDTIVIQFLPQAPHDSSHYPFSLRDVPARESLKQWHSGEILPKVTISTARQQKQGWACDLLKLAARSGD